MPPTPEELAKFLHDHREYNLAWLDHRPAQPVLHLGLADPARANPQLAALAFPAIQIHFHPTIPLRPLLCTPDLTSRSAPHQACQNEPIQLGCQIQPQKGDWVGTAGAPVRFPDGTGKIRWGILTNWHVLDMGVNPRGNKVFQPDRSRAAMATLINSAAPRTKTTNFVDAAVADSYIDGKHTTDWQILGFGQVNPKIIDAQPGLTVAKTGRTTGLTRGVCIATGAAATVDYGTFTAVFADQDVYRATGQAFSAPGDSGSLIAAETCRCPTGLLFAGGGDITIANPMRHVEKALKVWFNHVV